MFYPTTMTCKLTDTKFFFFPMRVSRSCVTDFDQRTFLVIVRDRTMSASVGDISTQAEIIQYYFDYCIKYSKLVVIQYSGIWNFHPARKRKLKEYFAFL